MKILYVITKSSEGGAQTHIMQLTRAMIAQGHQVAVMSAPRGWLQQAVVSLGGIFFPNEYFRNSYNPLLALRIRRKLREAISEFQPDLISCHSGFAGFMTRLIVRNRVPTLFTAHGWSFSPGSPRLQRTVSLAAELLAARWCEKIICVSEFDRQLGISRGIASPEKLITIRNGVELPDNPPPIRTSLRRAVFVGRLVGQKRPLDVLQAVALLPQEIRAALQISFIGDGPLQPMLQEYAERHQLTPYLHFYGNIHRDRVLELLRLNDLFLLPTNHEGLPRSIIEALSLGLPVLSSAVAGVPELIQDTVGYLLTPGNEAAELAQHIVELYEHPELLSAMSSNAYRRAKEHFSIERTIGQTMDVYREIVND